MFPIDDDLDPFRTGGAPCARILSVDRAGTVLQTWEDENSILLGGSAISDRRRLVRGQCSIPLANPDGSLSPNGADDPFFTERLFRLERGADNDGVKQYAEVGTYVVSGFDASMNGNLNITGEDPLYSAMQPIGDVLTLPAGTPAADVCRIMLEPILGDSALWTLDDGGMRTGAVRSFVEDDDRLTRLAGLMADLGLELFSDRLGRPVLQPLVDPTTVTPSQTHRQLPGEARMVTLQRSGSQKPVNRVIVIGQGVRGQADITDPAHPWHVDRIGLRVSVYRSAQITDQGQAHTVATNRLIALVLAVDSIGSDLLPDFSVDAGDVHVIEEAISGTNSRYWIQARTLPVVRGTMSIVGSTATPLFATNVLAS